MYFKHLVFVFLCLGVYEIDSSSVLTKIPTDYPSSEVNDENYGSIADDNAYSLDNHNHLTEYHHAMNTIENDVRSEALIKKIHPFIYPKQFNTLETIDPNNINMSTINFDDEFMKKHSAENVQRKDDFYSSFDQKAPPHVVDGSHHATQKHGYYHHDSYDRPTHQTNTHHIAPCNMNNRCLLGLLHLVDPLFLMAVLGFVAYIINSILSLVDKINLPTLLNQPSAAMTVATASTKSGIPQRLYDTSDILRDKSVDTNQHLLKDFERILQIAIDFYEQKLNSNQ